MWCYQKPGFEALILAELQRQQKCSQFCDTLLKTEDVSVPAHSCILSAISPHISSALSSTPPPPAGHTRLLDFRALGACTLFHMVRLLYCGEMAGEGEKEKQEAISAAAKLGIHGLVEVTRRERTSGNEGEDRRLVEVGVQTEPEEGRRGRWRREVRDGSSFLWKEALSDGERDMWTQTEEPAVSFETIDVSALQGLGQSGSQIPYIPLPLVYQPDENQPSSTGLLLEPPHTFIPPPQLPYSSHATPWAADPQSWWASSRNEEDEQVEQFQGNIPGYINYFLNPNKEERGRARGRRAAGGARRGGTGERRTRRPRGRTGGRGRGGLTQTVDVQDVGVGRLQKMFLQRSGGLRATRTGQGGGAAGRKSFLKTRELLKTAKSRKRGRGKVWDFSESGDLPLFREGGGNTQRGRRRSMTQQINQDGLPVSRPQRARAKPSPSVCFSSPHMPFYSVPSFNPALHQPSPSPALLSPAASYMSPAPSLLPPAPPPPEEQPENFERLLEEVMMGLDILPNNNSGAPHSAQSKQQDRTAGSTQVVTVARGDSGSADSGTPVLQQQREGELNEMLDHFLQSFEQHVDSCAAREEVEMCSEASQPYSSLNKYRKTSRPQNTHTQSDEAETRPRHSQPRKAPARSAAPPERTEESPRKVKPPARRRRTRNEYRFSLERVKMRVRKTKVVQDGGDEKLQQRPVVKLERRGRTSKVALQDVKQSATTKTSSSSVSRDSLSEAAQPATWILKTYPIRSRFRQAQIVNTMPFLEEPLQNSAVQPSRKEKKKKNGQLLSLQEPCDTDEQSERNQERDEEKSTVQPREDTWGPRRRGAKRRVKSEEMTDESTAAKRVCSEPGVQTSSKIHIPNSKPAPGEFKDISNVGDHLQTERQEEEPVWSEARESLMHEDVEGSSGDEMIDVDEATRFVKSKPRVSPSELTAKDVRLGSTGSWVDDEDIDVIGGSSPAPDPVIITWTESSEGEEEEDDEDVDVVGEKTDYASSDGFFTVSTAELVNRKYQSEVILH